MLFERVLREKRVYVLMFTLALFLGCLPTTAGAMPVDSKTESSILTKSYQNDLEVVSKFFEEEAVAKKLSKLGLSKDQIKEKLSSLDKGQIHLLATRIESIEKAGSTGIVVAILVIFLVFISFLYFTGRKIKIEKE